MNKIWYVGRDTGPSSSTQITGQEESSRKSFSSGWVGIVVRCVTLVGKL